MKTSTRIFERANRFSIAFTLIELLAVAAVVVILAALSMPAFSRTRTKARQVECFDNLRQVMVAELNWVHDSQKNTFQWRTPVTYGGLSPDPVSGAGADPRCANAFFHWWWIRNQLSSPRVLVCPADTLQPVRKVATDWGSGDLGFLNTANRDNALSYWVGTDAGCDQFTKHPKPPGIPGSWMPMPIEKCLNHVVTGDRNINFNGQRSACSAGMSSVWVIDWWGGVSPGIAWTNAVHINKGHLAMGDGHVALTTITQFTNLMRNADDSGNVHILSP